MSAVLTVQPTWLLTDIIAAAGQPLDRAYTLEGKLYLPDVTQEAANVALGGYDDAVSQQAKQWSVVRIERNAKLSECDWTQLVDSALSVEAQAAWGVYRQALRDIPADNNDPYNIDWPTAP